MLFGVTVRHAYERGSVEPRLVADIRSTLHVPHYFCNCSGDICCNPFTTSVAEDENNGNDEENDDDNNLGSGW